MSKTAVIVAILTLIFWIIFIFTSNYFFRPFVSIGIGYMVGTIIATYIYGGGINNVCGKK